MVVQHNLTAMKSNRMLGLTTKTQAKSTEKLSSGYKINHAADDAAGLSISEKMRKQIRGLIQASLNAQDGISAVQTAEGALNEVQDMLQRMNELAVKSANGTNSATDRTYIQNEIDQRTPMQRMLLIPLRLLFRLYPPSVPHLVQFKTDLSTPSTTWTTL